LPFSNRLPLDLTVVAATAVYDPHDEVKNFSLTYFHHWHLSLLVISLTLYTSR